MSELTIAEKKKIICEKFDELIKLIVDLDVNNVGLPWPEDLYRAGLLDGIKEAYKND